MMWSRALALPRTVYVLGIAALLNDAASEMVAPLLPVFITAALGASPAVVGLIEGVAEAAAGGLRLLGGALMDRGVPAGRLVQSGYALSNVGRPLLAIMTIWPFVLLVRLVDRLGKGLRSAPRDALIAGAVVSEERGLAFGVQRSLDHAGAVIGPLLATAALAWGASVPHVFALSAIPGIALLVMLWLALPSSARAPRVVPPRLRFRELDVRLWGLLGAATVLSFAAVPEAFLMLWARAHGFTLAQLPLLWAATSVVKMGVAIPAGTYADRFGRMPVLIVAWSLRVAVLLTLALPALRPWQEALLVLAYGGSLAIAEPAERALLADVAPAAHLGSLYGAYYLLCGLGVLPGAVLFGSLWSSMGAAIALQWAAALSALAAVLMGVARYCALRRS